MPASDAARAAARVYYEQVMATAVCAQCGAQPVEWHHPDHALLGQPRVSKMVWLGWGVHRIKAEMARCTPLCRGCHMAEDGRAGAPRPNYKPKPTYRGVCVVCGKQPKSRTRRKMCHPCYERKRARGDFRKEPTK